MSCTGVTSSSLPGLTVHVQALGKIDQCLGTAYDGHELVEKHPMGTFFYADYPRMQHYAHGDVYQSIQGTLTFGGTVSVTIDRSADLIGSMNLRYDLPAWTENAGVAGTFDVSDTANTYAYTNAFGYFAIERAELKVGGVDIDRLTGDTLYIMDHYMRHEGKQAGRMVGDYPTFLDRMEAARFRQRLIVPLTFGCHRPDRPMHWLPSVAVFKQRVELRLCMRPLSHLIHTEGTGSTAYDAGVTNAADVNAILPNGTGTSTVQGAHIQLYVVLLTQCERDSLLDPARYHISQWHTQGPTHQMGAGATEDTKRISVNNYLEAMFFVPRYRPKWNLVLGTATARGYEWTDFSGVDVDMTGPAGPPAITIPSARPPLDGVRLTLNSSERFNNDWLTFTDFHGWHGNIRNAQLGIGMHPFTLRLDTPYPSGGLNVSMIDHLDLTVRKNTSTEIPDAEQADIFVDVYHYVRNVAEMADGIYRTIFTS